MVNNPIQSERYIATILVRLYEEWAKPTIVHAESITVVSFDVELLFEGQSAPAEWELFENVMQWLHKEGFIRFERVGAHVYEYYGVTLTLKAMEAMRKVPDPLSKTNRTLLDGLQEAVQEGKKSAIHSLVGASMTALYQTLTTVA